MALNAEANGSPSNASTKISSARCRWDVVLDGAFVTSAKIRRAFIAWLATLVDAARSF